MDHIWPSLRRVNGFSIGQSAVEKAGRQAKASRAWRAAGKLCESFTYDSLERLDTVSRNGTQTLNVDYDLIGNISSRSDVGTYSYHASKKHAVTAAGSNTFAYDANGNVITRNGATLGWASYDLPTALVAGSNSASFAYAPDRSRWRQVATTAGVTATTIYVAGILEKVSKPSLTLWKHTVIGPTGLGAVYVRRSDGTADTYYLTTDHLGSTDKILKAAGSTLQVAESFAPYGARRGSSWTGAPSGADLTAIGNSTPDGFTGQEMLDGVGLIHMNGRVYDPAVGRFLSVDPIVREAAASQSWNGYGYVEGRVLSWRDPSGWSGLESIVVTGRRIARDGTMIGSGFGGNLSGPAGISGPSMGSEYETDSGLEEMVVTATRLPPPPPPPNLTALPQGQQQANCPKPPAAPPGVSVDDNIDIAKDYPWLNPGATVALVVNVQNFGPWDYKRQGRKYVAFGNFNFGAVTAAMGMPYYVAQNGAGIYQQWRGAAADGRGAPILKWPYGDATTDAQQIQRGRQYVLQGCNGGAK